MLPLAKSTIILTICIFCCSLLFCQKRLDDNILKSTKSKIINTICGKWELVIDYETQEVDLFKYRKNNNSTQEELNDYLNFTSDGKCEVIPFGKRYQNALLYTWEILPDNKGIKIIKPNGAHGNEYLITYLSKRMFTVKVLMDPRPL